VSPGVSSGHGCSLQDYLAPPTGGKDIFLNGFTPGPLYFQMYGHLKVVATLTGQPGQIEWKYDWATPVTGAMTKEIENNGPFIAASAAICRINTDVDQKTNMASFFEPAVAIPAEWQSFVAPALQFMDAHPDLGLASPLVGKLLTQRQASQLEPLMAGDNPFISAGACRLLAQSGTLNPITLQAALAKSSGLRQALITFLAVDDTGQPGLLKVLGSLIESAKGPGQLKGIALGIFTADSSHVSQPALTSLMRQIVAKEQDQIVSEQSQVHGQSLPESTVASDKYLAGIFDSDMGLASAGSK